MNLPVQHDLDNTDIHEESSDIEILIEKDKTEQTELRLTSTQKIWKTLCTRFSFLDQSTTVSIVLYMILALTYMMAIQIYPVWASRAPDENGLGFEERQIGILNSVGAGSALIFQLLFFAPIDSYFGCTVSFRIALG